jgi:hypothetical protein
MDIAFTIRKEFQVCGKTRYQIAKETGIAESVLCRIAQGRPCESTNASILLEYFGYRLIKNPKKIFTTTPEPPPYESRMLLF